MGQPCGVLSQLQEGVESIFYCGNYSLNDVYAFEGFLKAKHPLNNNVQAKIRQQLQFLRDKNAIQFLGRGRYRMKLAGE
ncbi:MAG: hypothetical protein IT313_03275 [Anaerolineales bacterium]|nr:hypothetical protein [Anaerolineales bacterium]